MSNEEDEDRIRRILRSEEETQGVYNPTPPIPPTQGTTPIFTRPALDKDNMPLPRRVNETDMEGTRVTRAAYEPASRQVPPQQPPVNHPPTQPKKPSIFRRGNMGCFLRGLIASIFALVVVGLLAGSYFVYRYYLIANTLPDVSTLRDRASQFQTTRILDRNGQLLYEVLDPTAGRRNYIPLANISPNLVAATISTEDKEFYTNPGFDPVAIVRALWQNYATSGQGGGASTITQQLARALLLSPEERSQRTVTRKAREIILSAEITRRYTKDEILELYLNEIYYGNLAYGVQAAAETYFGKSAKELTLG